MDDKSTTTEAETFLYIDRNGNFTTLTETESKYYTWDGAGMMRAVSPDLVALIRKWKRTPFPDDLLLSGVVADKMEDEHPGDWPEYDALILFMRKMFVHDRKSAPPRPPVIFSEFPWPKKKRKPKKSAKKR
jgi:hypothetical protein